MCPRRSLPKKRSTLCAEAAAGRKTPDPSGPSLEPVVRQACTEPLISPGYDKAYSVRGARLTRVDRAGPRSRIRVHVCCCWLFALPVRQPAWGVGRVRFASRPPPLGAFWTTLAGWALFPKGTGKIKRVWTELSPRHLVGLFMTGPKDSTLLTKKHVLAGGGPVSRR